MKIETIPIDNFQPFAVQLTVESKQELDLLIEVCRFNQSIPEMVSEDPSSQQIVVEFLDVLRAELFRKL